MPCPKTYDEIGASHRFEYIAHREYLAARHHPKSNVMSMAAFNGSREWHPINQLKRYHKGIEFMSGLITVMAAKQGVAANILVDSVKKAVGLPHIQNDQLALYLLTCNKYDLDPLLGEVWMMEKGGKCSVSIGVDGWTKLVNRQPEYNGVQFKELIDDQGNLVAIKCMMHRRDREFPTEVTEWMVECKQNSKPWQSHPHRMLRHKAFQQAARLCFGLNHVIEDDTIDTDPGVNTPELEGVKNVLRHVGHEPTPEPVPEPVQAAEPEAVEPDIAEEAAAEEEARAAETLPPSEELFPEPTAPHEV